MAQGGLLGTNSYWGNVGKSWEEEAMSGLVVVRGNTK